MVQLTCMSSLGSGVRKNPGLGAAELLQRQPLLLLNKRPWVDPSLVILVIIPCRDPCVGQEKGFSISYLSLHDKSLQNVIS